MLLISKHAIIFKQFKFNYLLINGFPKFDTMQIILDRKKNSKLWYFSRSELF